MTGPEVTAAVRRAMVVLGNQDPGWTRDTLTAALNRDAIARSVADNLYGQDVHTLVMRRPGETYRDQAERIGQWAAGVVVASVLGSGS